MRNDGNVMSKPSGSLKIVDSKGNTVLDQRFQLDTFLPHTTIDYPVNVVERALDVGTYSTRVVLAFEGAGGMQTGRFSPKLVVTPANVTQVFTSAAPPTPAPTPAKTTRGGATTATGSTSKVSTATVTFAAPASAAADSGGGGISTGLIVLLAIVGGIALLGAGYLLALRTARKS
jgi:hypothetical protein